MIPEYCIGSPVFLEYRVALLIDGEGRDALDEGEAIDLVHGVEVGVRELVVLHIGEVVSEPGEEGDQLIVGQEIELHSGGLQRSVPVPGPVQVFYGGRSVNTGIMKLDEERN